MPGSRSATSPKAPGSRSSASVSALNSQSQSKRSHTCQQSSTTSVSRSSLEAARPTSGQAKKITSVARLRTSKAALGDMNRTYLDGMAPDSKLSPARQSHR